MSSVPKTLCSCSERIMPMPLANQIAAVTLAASVARYRTQQLTRSRSSPRWNTSYLRRAGSCDDSRWTRCVVVVCSPFAPRALAADQHEQEPCPSDPTQLGNAGTLDLRGAVPARMLVSTRSLSTSETHDCRPAPDCLERGATNDHRAAGSAIGSDMSRRMSRARTALTDLTDHKASSSGRRGARVAGAATQAWGRLHAE